MLLTEFTQHRADNYVFLVRNQMLHPDNCELTRRLHDAKFTFPQGNDLRFNLVFVKAIIVAVRIAPQLQAPLWERKDLSIKSPQFQKGLTCYSIDAILI